MSDADTDFSLLGTHAPTQPLAQEATVSVPPALRISSYKILGVLGEGSMGIVYRAEQDNPHRVVALKVLKAGDTSPRALRRFEHEAHLLGRLQHPGIAQIFEAGTADAGYGPQPFLAMELVEGVPLKEYADLHGLNAPQRLALLVKVCEGVQHAHQKGIIHRDLKPGNILVDEMGQPKILDFGIALATEADTQAATFRTDLEQLAGTLPYMSLEQVNGDPNELDTRTDVYALGVIAYQLLSGRLPYDLKHKTIPEAVRIIGEQEPRQLGTIDKAFRGDVETIVGKALEKDKTRRYQSASDLAADIRRHLSDEPILARPPSTIYQFRKFAKRNRTLVSGVVGMLVMLLVAIIGTSVGLRESMRAQEKAQEQADKLKAVNEFLVNDMLTSADPKIAQGRKITVEEVLQNASDRIDTAFPDQPETEASIRDTIGKIYRSLGVYDRAELHLRPAEAIRRRELGDEDADTLRSRTELGGLLKDRGKYVEAEALLRRTLEIQKRILGDDHADTLKSMNELALLLKTQGNVSEAERLYLQTFKAQRRVLGDEHPETLETRHNLADLLSASGDLSEAESSYRQILDIERRVLGDEHPHTLMCMNNLALVLKVQGRLSEAEPLYTRILEIQRRILGDEHPHTLTSRNNLAVLLKTQGKLSEAATLYRETLDTRRRLLGDQHPDTITSMHNLALVLQAPGELTEAEELYRKTVEFLRQKLGNGHRKTIVSITSLAVLLAKKGDYTEAASLHREVLTLRRERLPEGHPDIATSLIRLGTVLIDAGDPTGAEPLLRECLAIRRQAFPEGDWRIANAENAMGACLTALQRFSEAEPLLLGSYPIIKAEWDETDERTQRACKRIIDLYEAWGKPDRALRFREGVL